MLVLPCHCTEQAHPPGNNDPLAGSASPLWVAPLSQAACLSGSICICNDLIAEPR